MNPLIFSFVIIPSLAFAKEKSIAEAAVIGAGEGAIMGIVAIIYWYLWPSIKRKIDRLQKLKATQSNKLSPLMIAAADGDDSEVERLIVEGVDVNATGKSGETALMLAARNDKRSTLRLLIKNGANVFAKTNKGNDARDIARKHRKLEMASILCEYMDD